MQLLLQIVKSYREIKTKVYFVGLTDDVREVFTRANMWKVLGDNDYTAVTIEECISLIEQHGGNRDVARQLAEKEDRTIDAELARLAQLDER
jgi:hypothetical protein